MHKQFTENLSNHIKDSSLPQKEKVFRWLNPLKPNLSQKKTDELLSNLPQEIQKQLLEDSTLRNFFEDDIRALRLYLKTVPVSQILSEETLDDHIEPEEFNKFFRENYITNQAYKLSDQERQNYTSQISENTTWQDYVLSETNKASNIGKVEPNYSINYFLTSLNPTTRLEYLNDINLEDTPEESPNDLPTFNSTLNDLPELGSLSSFSPNQTTNDPTQTYESFTLNSQKETLQTSAVLPQEEQVQTTIKPQIQDQNIELSQEVIIQKPLSQLSAIDLESSRISQFDRKVQANSTSQNKEQETQDKPTPQAQVLPQNQPKLKIQEPIPQSRRKPLNYAKIVGYSSAAGISLGTGGLTIINTLFGS